MIVRFEVEGKAVGKARPRVTAHGTYTPRATREYEAKVRAAFLRDCPGVRFAEGDPVALTVVVVKAPPKSASRAKRAAMLAGDILPVQRPDWDNYGKVVSDALNGAAWGDDSQVVYAEVLKIYGERERMCVAIMDADHARGRMRELRSVFGV